MESPLRNKERIGIWRVHEKTNNVVQFRVCGLHRTSFLLVRRNLFISLLGYVQNTSSRYCRVNRLLYISALSFTLAVCFAYRKRNNRRDSNYQKEAEDSLLHDIDVETALISYSPHYVACLGCSESSHDNSERIDVVGHWWVLGSLIPGGLGVISTLTFLFGNSLGNFILPVDFPPPPDVK